MKGLLARRVRVEVTGIVALAVVLALPSAGVGGAVRDVLAGFGMIVVPGWLIVRQADEAGDWVVRLFGGALVSVCAYVLFGFAAYEVGLRLTGVVYIVPAVIVAALAIVLTGAASRSSAPLASVGIAALLSLAGVAGALVAHLALPPAPVEAAYSITTTSLEVTPSSIWATVAVDRVGTGAPVALLLYVDGRLLATAPVPAGARSVTLTAWRSGTVKGRCPRRIAIVAPGGTYLAPTFHCTGS